MLAVFLLPANLRAQCSSAPAPPPVQQAFERQNWPAIVRLAQTTPILSPQMNFDLGMAFAHLGKLPEARRALLAGQRQCSADTRFPEELAGVAFEQKHDPEAAHWLRRALHLDPHDAYAANFLGTVEYLTGNLPAALQAWNRIGKPSIDTLDLDPHLRVHHLLLDRAFVFAPHSVLRASQFTATEARLDGLGIFPSYSLQLAARPNGSFDAVFRAQERNGFGSSRLAAMLSALGGLPYETVYPTYANIHRDAMNFDSLLRWDSQKRRVWLSLSAPPNRLPQWRWHVSTEWRGENWAIRPSFTGTAPVLGSLHLDREAFSFGLTSFPTGRLQWTLGGNLSHRTFTHIVPGSALTPSLLTSGYAVQVPASVQYRLLDLPAHRFTLTAAASSAFGRTLTTPTHTFEKLQGSALAHWLPTLENRAWELRQQLRAGRISGSPPFDNLCLFGMDRDDTDLGLRAHIATRDGRKGSAPIGDGYFLANTDLFRRLYANGLLSINAGPLLDIGRMTAPTPGLSSGQWLFDTGVEARLTVLHTSVVLSYGRDLRSGANAFYGSVAPPSSLP
ncbi:MAG TPA: tetratricopeptide repeat protein [Acidobacteriaceae bacterium]|nr:tetratricopeptide repeat protein [Acidobacteriaceae bacterium]